MADTPSAFSQHPVLWEQRREHHPGSCLGRLEQVQLDKTPQKGDLKPH
jgi:hypothetical protein